MLDFQFYPTCQIKLKHILLTLFIFHIYILYLQIPNIMSYENIKIGSSEDNNSSNRQITTSQIYAIDDMTQFKYKRQYVIEKIITCIDWLNERFDMKNVKKGGTLYWERQNGEIHFYSPENNTIFQYLTYGMLFDTKTITTGIKSIFYEYTNTHVSSYLYELFLEYETFIYNQSTKKNVCNKCETLIHSLEKMNEMVLCSTNQTPDMIVIWNVQYNSLMSCLNKVCDKTINPLDTVTLDLINEIVTLLESGIVTSELFKNINKYQKYDNLDEAIDKFLWDIPYDTIYDLASNANNIIKNVQKNSYVSYRLKNAINLSFENIRDSLMRKYISSIGNISEKNDTQTPIAKILASML